MPTTDCRGAAWFGGCAARWPLGGGSWGHLVSRGRQNTLTNFWQILGLPRVSTSACEKHRNLLRGCKLVQRPILGVVHYPATLGADDGGGGLPGMAKPSSALPR